MTTYAIEGQGATIAFSVSDFTSDVLSITLPTPAVAEIDTTHLGTSDSKTSKPAKLKDNGEVAIEFDHNPAAANLIGIEQTFTITYPLLTGQTTPASIAFAGYVKSQGGEEFKTDTKMTTKVAIKISGPVTATAAV